MALFRPNQELVNVTAVAAYCDGQEIRPLSSGKAGDIPLRLLNLGAGLDQMAAVRLDDRLRTYAVVRAMAVHALLGINVPRAHIEDGINRATGVGLNVAEMATIAAATGHMFQNGISALRPTDGTVEAASAALDNPKERKLVVARLARFSNVMSLEDGLTHDGRRVTDGLSLDQAYRLALRGRTSDYFPVPGDRHQLREQLMAHLSGRLDRGLTARNDHSQKMIATRHALFTGPPDDTVAR